MTKQDTSLDLTQTLELNSNSLIGCLEEERGGCEQFAWAFTQRPSYQLEWKLHSFRLFEEKTELLCNLVGEIYFTGKLFFLPLQASHSMVQIYS